MGNVLDKSCIENRNKHFMFENFFFRKSHRLWDNVKKYSGAIEATNDVTIWRIRVAYWISKAICTYAHAHTHTPEYPYARTHKYAHTNQYVILIALPQQQWFRERASVLCYTYIDCLVFLPLFLSTVPSYAFQGQVFFSSPLSRAVLGLTQVSCTTRVGDSFSGSKAWNLLHTSN